MTKLILANSDTGACDALASSLRTLRPQWIISRTSYAADILNQVENDRIDCVVSDVTLDDMSGFELLSRLQSSAPHVVRITLTSELDQEVVLESTRSNHRFINSSVSDAVLVDAIEASLKLELMLGDDALKRRIGEIRNLPSLPTMYQRMVSELTLPQSSLLKVASIIEEDIGLTATVLKIVNSAFYGLDQRVESVPQAVSLLGVHLIKNITLTAKVFKQFEAAEMNLGRLRRLNDEANRTGALSNHFARLARVPRTIADHAQIAGMLSSVGQLVLLAEPNLAKWQDGRVNSELLGAHLMSLWLMPHPVIEAIALQHISPPHPSASITPLSIIHAVRYLNKHISDASDAEQRTQCQDYLEAMVPSPLAQSWLDAYCDQVLLNSDLPVCRAS